MKRLLNLLFVPVMAFLCCQSAWAAGLTETVVTPPALVDARNYPVSIIPHGDGSVDYFAALIPHGAPAELRRYQSKDGGKSWTEIPCKWAAPVAKQFGRYEESQPLTEEINLTDDGACYFAVPDKNGISHMIEAKPDGSYREIPIPAWKTDHEGMTILNQQTTADAFHCSFLTMPGWAYAETIDRKTGQIKRSVEDDGQGWDVLFSGNTALMGGMSDYLSFYDLASGKRIRDVKLPRKSDGYGTGDMVLTLDEKGAAYVAGKHGLERLAPGGSVFETILAGDRCYLGDQTCSLREMRKQPGADVFYINLQIDGEMMLCRYAA